MRSSCVGHARLLIFAAALLAPASLAAVDAAALPRPRFEGAEKVLSPALLAQDGPVRAIVLLTGYDRFVGRVHADRPAEMAVLHDRIARMEDSVLAATDPIEVRPTWRYENFPAFAATLTRSGLEALARLDSVRSIEEDIPLEVQLRQGLALIEADVPRTAYGGRGVAIGIIDTGIDYNHERLGGGGFPNAKVIGGHNFDPGATDPNDPLDCVFHGTAVAGVSAGDLATGPGDYVGGVAPEAKIYALKVTPGCGGGTNASLITAAIDWAVTHQYDDPANPILVLNASLGGGYFTSACDSSNPATAAAADSAAANGITIFAASGNSGFCDGLSDPACLSNVVSVGAVFDADVGPLTACIDNRSCIGSSAGCFPYFWACTQSSTQADLVTCYSNSADFLDLLAPSNDTYTTDLGGGYTPNFGGTSCASPYAAGAAAVLQSSAAARSEPFYTPQEVRDILVSTGTPVQDPRNGLVKPRIDLGAAVPAMEICDDGKDNDGDTFADCADSDCQVDADGDGVNGLPCGTDCDDDDPDVWHEPDPVTRLLWSGKADLAWTDPGFRAGGASLYQLLRGRIEELPLGTGASETCLDPSVAALGAPDPTVTAEGDLYFYLVRGANSCSPPGGAPYGRDGSGSPRTSSACP